MLAQPAPSFAQTATSGLQISTQSLLGQSYVLYFYPKDNTPGCTTETAAFRDAYADFSALGCAVFGVSRDSLKSHENFKAKLELPFELISDPEAQMCQAFAVMKEKNMYGKKVWGIERSTFLIDAQGVVVQVWRGVKVPGHVEAVLQSARALMAQS